MPSTANVTESHIDRLWLRMSEIFGHKWTASYGATPSETWLAGLIDMSDEELRTGLVGCLHWYDPWPPTLPQFRLLCRPRREDAHRIFCRALPEPPESKARRMSGGLAAIDGIREGLRLTAWLEAHQTRRASTLDAMLAAMRFWIARCAA